MPKLSTQELKTILQNERLDALSSSASSELADQRTDALNYFNGDVSKDLPALEGRSQAVSTDVSDSIEGLMPSLMDIFAGADDVVRFDPVGPEDVEPAQQETDFVNYVFMQQNSGFLVLYSMIKDALLSKTGIAKVWWEKKETDDKDTYYDQPDDVYNLLASDPSIEIIAHTENEGIPTIDPQTGQLVPTKLHDITIKTTRDESKCCVEAVPPEEFGISRRARLDMQDATYLFHEVVKTQKELIDQGYDIEQVKSLSTYSTPVGSGWSQERYARDTVLESTERGGDDALNKAIRPLRVTEHYTWLDYEGDGTARRYCVTTGGEDSEVLRRDGKPAVDEVDWWPFAAMTPFINTHRFIGRSIADVTMDIQRIKTVLVRGLLDNMGLSNNPRTQVPEDNCTPETIDDLLNSRQGGIVRSKRSEPFPIIAVPDITAGIYPALQYFDATREWRTGVSRQGQGLDAEALNNQTATAAMQLYNASQARMKLIARVFAETGICDLFWLIHSTVRKYGEQAMTVKLRNQWVTVDPREWKERKDMSIDVGLGHGGQAERANQVMGIIGLQKEALVGGMSMLVTPKQLYNSAAEYCKANKIKDPERYFTDPGEDAQMPEPPPDPAMVKAQADAQMSAQKAQMDSQLKQQELQLKAQIEKLQAEADVATQNAKTQAEITLIDRKFQLERELKIMEFQLKAQSEQASLDMKDKSEARKLRMEANSKAVGGGAQLDEQGNVGPSKLLESMVERLAKGQQDSHAAIMDALTAERETEITRDPKTNRALKATSRVKRKAMN